MLGKAIAISGPPGAGTTTIARALAERLGLKYANAGTIFRDLAKEYGMSLLEFQDYAMKHPEIDKEIDRRSVELLKIGGYVVEGRLAAHMAVIAGLKNVLKVYLKASEDVRAERIAKRENISVEEALRHIKERASKERERYLKIYGIDVDNLMIYDLVIDTTYLTPDVILDVIITFWKGWQCDEKQDKQD
ncbi:MAG: cytidylate kinase [Thermoplasmata archaeon]|nr:AAA family ATPase [Euryarchaeota archaeon]RLF67137.1 MAG: cytidylate kinase [Thermoplasmata archaeon]